MRELDAQIKEANQVIQSGIYYDNNGKPQTLTLQQLNKTKENVANAMSRRQSLAVPPRMEELMEAQPDLFSSDSEVSSKASAPYLDVLKEFGFSQPEIQTTDDPRIFFMMKELLEGRDLQSRVNKAKAKPF